VLDRLTGATPNIYLHIDLDSLDPVEGRTNEYAAPGGVLLTELESAIGAIFDRFLVAAAAVTAYDPTLDRDGRMGKTAVRVIEAIAREVEAHDGARRRTWVPA
jgi:arginase